ncbi:hypothetical protein [Gleimia hominis]|uniref:hypothetical protein n=1 Tax=Gleimia hominis TaxID=595468 RepID=UPI000CC61D81|nr:hypothetical protein [Gleimia hominis]WIK64747.1 hypothetical protein CJ187_001395 [Gleimia hominis]
MRLESQMNAKPEDSQEGRISLMVIVLAAILVALALTLAAISTVHLQRRGLYTCADVLSQNVVLTMEADKYFDGHQDLTITSQVAHQEAQRLLEKLGDTTCDVGQSPRVVRVDVVPDAVTVYLETNARFKILPRSLQAVTQDVRLRVASTAHAY